MPSTPRLPGRVGPYWPTKPHDDKDLQDHAAAHGCVAGAADKALGLLVPNLEMGAGSAPPSRPVGSRLPCEVLVQDR